MLENEEGEEMELAFVSGVDRVEWFFGGWDLGGHVGS